jgi:hypothetical protein
MAMKKRTKYLTIAGVCLGLGIIPFLVWFSRRMEERHRYLIWDIRKRVMWIGSTLLSTRDVPLEEILGSGPGKGELAVAASAEKVLGEFLQKHDADENLVYVLYRQKVKPSNPTADTAVGKWGSSYYSWRMSAEKWKLASHFLWYSEDERNGVPERFPMLWQKRPDLSGGNVTFLTWEGASATVWAQHQFDPYLKDASDWVNADKIDLESALGLLRTGTKRKKAWALRLLGAGCRPEMVSVIGEFVRDKDYEIRRAAVSALGLTRRPEALALLRHCMEDSVRFEVARSLGQIGGASVLEPLGRLLRDKDHQVRWYAALALGQTGLKEALPPLLKALEQDSGLERAVLSSLKRLGWTPPPGHAIPRESPEKTREAVPATVPKPAPIETVPTEAMEPSE